MLLSDNVRKFRRQIQGRGINIRETLVAGVNATRLPIANLKDDDAITKFLNMTDLLDASADIAMELDASVTLFTTNKAVKYTARKPGVAGPGTDEVRIKYTDTNVADDPLVVTVTRDGLIVLIDVQLAQSSSAVITTTAAEARVAVLQHPEASKLVDAALVGTGATLLTPTGPHKLGATVAGDVSASVVGYLRRQGATAATLDTAMGVDADGLERDLHFEAVTPGATQAGGQGNALPITVQIGESYSPDAAETTVVVTDGPYTTAIAVTPRALGGFVLATGDEVMAAIRASADAAALVTVRALHGRDAAASAPGVVEALGPSALTGGEDSGIHVSTNLSGKNINVAWITGA